MNFLVIAQDLRVSKTSEGIVSRSFIANLRKVYPKAIIDVLYLTNHETEDQLDLLPIDSIKVHLISVKVTFLVKWINRVTRRVLNLSWYDRHVHKAYGKYIKAVDEKKYDHVFIRSAGLNHQTLLASKDLPILKKAIINFHDPYPFFWYQGSKYELFPDELTRLKKMFDVVSQARRCITTANRMSNDLEFLYGSRKQFHTLPHQFSHTVFDLTDTEFVLPKKKKLTLTYHGSIQFGRQIDNLLDAYDTITKTNPLIKENTDFVLRLLGGDVQRIREKYQENTNISVLHTLNFSNSCYEQKHVADINVILENGPLYCNILVGKAPFLASLRKPVFCVSPKRSELRGLIKDERYIATGDNREEIKTKLESLIMNRMEDQTPVDVFGDYFSFEHFKTLLNEIL